MKNQCSEPEGTDFSSIPGYTHAIHSMLSLYTQSLSMLKGQEKKKETSQAVYNQEKTLAVI